MKYIYIYAYFITLCLMKVNKCAADCKFENAFKVDMCSDESTIQNEGCLTILVKPSTLHETCNCIIHAEGKHVDTKLIMYPAYIKNITQCQQINSVDNTLVTRQWCEGDNNDAMLVKTQNVSIHFRNTDLMLNTKEMGFLIKTAKGERPIHISCNEGILKSTVTSPQETSSSSEKFSSRQTKFSDASTATPTASNYPIIIGAVGGGLVIVAAIVLFVLYRRRIICRNRKKNPPPIQEQTNNVNVVVFQKGIIENDQYISSDEAEDMTVEHGEIPVYSQISKQKKDPNYEDPNYEYVKELKDADNTPLPRRDYLTAVPEYAVVQKRPRP